MTSEPLRCGLCGHEMTFERCGAAGATEDGWSVYLCHAEDHDCYRAWTVYGARPATNVGDRRRGDAVEAPYDSEYGRRSGYGVRPETLADVPPVAELGGAIGRQASDACRQGQHDLCTDDGCECRHHGLSPLERAALTRYGSDLTPAQRTAVEHLFRPTLRAGKPLCATCTTPNLCPLMTMSCPKSEGAGEQ